MTFFLFTLNHYACFSSKGWVGTVSNECKQHMGVLRYYYSLLNENVPSTFQKFVSVLNDFQIPLEFLLQGREEGSTIMYILSRRNQTYF